MEFLKNEVSCLPLSNMSESGDYIFSSDYIRNCQFNGWISVPQSMDNLHAHDYNKHYTSCLMGKKCTFGWPVYPSSLSQRHEPLCMVSFDPNHLPGQPQPSTAMLR
jgi:hypothetical protein